MVMVNFGRTGLRVTRDHSQGIVKLGECSDPSLRVIRDAGPVRQYYLAVKGGEEEEKGLSCGRRGSQINVIHTHSAGKIEAVQ